LSTFKERAVEYQITPQELVKWCRIPSGQLEKHPDRRIPFRMVADSAAMGQLMAKELVEEIQANSKRGEQTRAIIPCGPAAWYQPFTDLVNRESVSLKSLVVFHMDECLDWQGRLLPKDHPYNFRGFMEKYFYGGIRSELAVPVSQRNWVTPLRVREIEKAIDAAPIDYCLGGWGQDGHVAYNQTRRHPFSRITLDDLRNSTVRVQDNNLDTIMALGNRSFGSAYQLVPPMSVTVGIRQCMSAKKVRIFSDTGAWKQTALRVALFAPHPTTEYPMTLLAAHPDALITATASTAHHPLEDHPEWDFTGASGYFEE